jgi:hypothetical protein
MKVWMKNELLRLNKEILNFYFSIGKISIHHIFKHFIRCFPFFPKQFDLIMAFFFEFTSQIFTLWLGECHWFKGPLWMHSFFKNSSILIWFPRKFNATWMTKNLAMLMWNMTLCFKFIYNLENLQLWQFKQSHSPTK